MPKRCPFCDQDADTKEHVWGKAINSRLEQPAVTAVRGHARLSHQTGQGQGRQLAVYPTKGLVLTVPVCGACNGGWMSDLEGASGELVVRMATGEALVLLSRADRFNLARYALKTAVAAEAANPRTLRPQPVFPASDIDSLREGAVPANLVVSLFRYDAIARVGSIGVGPLDLRAGAPDGPRHSGYAATCSVHHLVFQVLGTDGPVPLTYPRLAPDYRVQIWPEPTVAAVPYPPSRTLTDVELTSLSRMGPWVKLPDPDGIPRTIFPTAVEPSPAE